jgi:hypothetical protein
MDNNKIIEQLNTLIQKTKERKISWKLISNQKIARWIKSEKARVFIFTLQALPPFSPTTSQASNYAITIQIANPDETLLQLNTTTEPLFKTKLEELFKEIILISENRSIETINDFLANI